MAKYNGSVEMHGGLKPKNNGDFPLVDARDVQADDTGKRLDEKLAEIEQIALDPGVDDDVISDLTARVNTLEETVNDLADEFDTKAKTWDAVGDSFENFLGDYADKMEEVDEAISQIGNEAATYAMNAQQSSEEARAAAQNAEASAARAEAADTAAEQSAENAANDAQTATTAAENAGKAKTAAEQAASNAASSASAASTSATNAGKSATAATTSAQTASTAATNATAAKTVAETAKGEAQTAATNAGKSATAAAGSATTASNAATAAQTAQSKAETAQAATEAAKAEFEQKLASGDYKGDPYTLTEADKATIVQSVIESLGGQPVAGYFDENNDIVLTSTLPDGVYTIKIETEEGLQEIGSVNKTTVKEYTITWKNYDGTVLETDTVTEGTVPVYNGSTPTRAADSQYTYTFKGWDKTVVVATANATYTATYTQTAKEPTYENLADPNSADWKTGYRLSISSGSPSNSSYATGHTVTNFIPCKAGYKLRVEGMTITGSIGGASDTADHAKIVHYNSSKTKIGGLYGNTSTAEKTSYASKVTTSNGVSEYTILMDNNGVQCATAQTAYIRIDGKVTGAASDVVINIIPS